MVVRIFFLVSILTGTLLPKYSYAQIDDIGIWTGISIQKQFTRKVEGSLTEQLRLNHDASTINLLLTDVGVEYAISKKFKAGIHYRFINANQVTYYSKRHRFYADLSFKEKIKTVSFTIRERIQEQFYDYYSSETGKIPYWTLRSKLTIKIDLKKKITPYLSGEIYYQIDNPKQLQGITRFRYEAGINYDINRVHSLNPFLLYQKAVPVDFIQFVYGLMYAYSF